MDVVLQSWRPIQPLDRIVFPQEQKPRRKYSCGDCGSQVRATTYFNGWEEEAVDMDTGDTITVIDGGRDDVFEVTYSCIGDCGWTAGAEWHDDITYARDEEEEEEEEAEIKITPQFYQSPFRFTADFEPF